MTASPRPAILKGRPLIDLFSGRLMTESSFADHQRDAARNVRDAKERLDQQMQQAAEMQRLRKQMQQGQDSGRKNGGNEEHLSPEDFTLPVPEDFQTPEEYRRALLEGMEADVPEEYRALNQRYFEELVRQ